MNALSSFCSAAATALCSSTKQTRSVCHTLDFTICVFAHQSLPQKEESITRRRRNGTAANSKMDALWAIDLSMPPYDKGDREGDLNKSGDMHFSDMMTMQTDERSAYHLQLQMQRQCQKQNPAVVINLRCCMEALNLDGQASSPKFPLYE